MMADKFSTSLEITNYMVDNKYRMRPAAFLDLSQFAADRAAKALDFGDDKLLSHHCAWILARTMVQFLRPVMYEEIMTLTTWHKGYSGLYFLRDHQLTGADGKPAVNSTSSWIVMDLEARNICRDSFLTEIIPTSPQSEDNAIEGLAPKVVAPRGKEMELIGTHKVNWSDVDCNQHANNVKYTTWAMDLLPEDLVYNHPLKELTVNFNKEAHQGDTVELWHTVTDKGSHIIEGKESGRQVFIEELVFGE